MNIDRIIRESINKVITEGYGAVHLEDQIEKRIQPLMNWIESCNNGTCKQLTVNDEFKINLKPYQKDGIYMQQKFQKNSKVHVTYTYKPDKVYDTGVIAVTKNRYHRKLREIYIDFFIGKTADANAIRSALKHELTHAMDVRTDEWLNGFFNGTTKFHQHQLLTNEYQEIPNELKELMYMLWDTSEFNAWQTSYSLKAGGFNGFVEMIMNYLRKAESINDPKVWSAVRAYLVSKNTNFFFGANFGQRGNRDFRRTPLPAVKKYFITTSFNKLKKFIKKVKI